MTVTKQTYETRKAEVDLSCDMLTVFEGQYNDENRIFDRTQVEKFTPILKSNILLMLYNLVESTVLNGIEEIYDRLKSHATTYSNVRNEIKDIWFSYRFKQAYGPTAHYESYERKAREIVDSIIQGKHIELNKKALPLSGNVDADMIRRICSDHGITFTADNACNGGERLKEIKTKRNELAHGTVSFAECGRDRTVQDIIEIKEQTYSFLDGLISGMEQYYNENRYYVNAET